jgi:serine/threonine protein kinase
VALTVGARLGPYEILGALGAGGMGEVYRARDTRLDRAVAVKILPAAFAVDPQFRERFDREARAISQLTHPHICTLYDVGEAPNPESLAPSPQPLRFLVMQLRRKYRDLLIEAAVCGRARRPVSVNMAVEDATASPITIVLNWDASLKK